MRPVTHRYEDPLDAIWIATADRIGLRIDRSEEVWASTDGRGTLTLGTKSTLDADDCLAQMIFHELCHSLVEGREAFEHPDWGLENEGERDLVREHACLRTQAFLAGRYGLRFLLAPTTDHRAFYDALLDPLEGRDPSVALARIAVHRAERDPWAPHLFDALSATSRIAMAAHPFSNGRSLLSRASAPAPMHPSGLFASARTNEKTCADCAWLRGRSRCEQAKARVDGSWPACERFEADLECRTCAACCREAYEVVELRPREAFVRRHPELVRRIDGRIVLPRADGRCVALEGEERYTCRTYEDRPRTCRDFEKGSANCLDARRRIGLTL